MIIIYCILHINLNVFIYLLDFLSFLFDQLNFFFVNSLIRLPVQKTNQPPP